MRNESHHVLALEQKQGESVSRKEKPMDTTERGNHETAEVRAKLSAAVERAKEVCQRLQDQTAAAAKATDQTIREHPYQALALALGLGLVTGLLLGRSRRD